MIAEASELESRSCWACREDRAAKTLAFCWLCAGTGSLPRNPLDRRGRDPQIARSDERRRGSDVRAIRGSALPPGVRALTPRDLAELDEILRLFGAQPVAIPVTR